MSKSSMGATAEGVVVVAVAPLEGSDEEAVERLMALSLSPNESTVVVDVVGTVEGCNESSADLFPSFFSMVVVVGCFCCCCYE